MQLNRIGNHFLQFKGEKKAFAIGRESFHILSIFQSVWSLMMKPRYEYCSNQGPQLFIEKISNHLNDSCFPEWLCNLKGIRYSWSLIISWFLSENSLEMVLFLPCNQFQLRSWRTYIGLIIKFSNVRYDFGFPSSRNFSGSRHIACIDRLSFQLDKSLACLIDHLLYKQKIYP